MARFLFSLGLLCFLPLFNYGSEGKEIAASHEKRLAEQNNRRIYRYGSYPYRTYGTYTYPYRTYGTYTYPYQTYGTYAYPGSIYSYGAYTNPYYSSNPYYNPYYYNPGMYNPYTTFVNPPSPLNYPTGYPGYSETYFIDRY